MSGDWTEMFLDMERLISGEKPLTIEFCGQQVMLAPVRRGKWIDGLDIPKEEREKRPYVYLHGEKHCSVCYHEAYFDTDYGQQLFDYCPNCGAKMYGGDGDG